MVQMPLWHRSRLVPASLCATLLALSACDQEIPTNPSVSESQGTVAQDTLPSEPLPAASSASYFVAPTGSDNNPGTSSAPFRTIQKAANVVQPGQTVIVRDGIYTGPTGGGSELLSIARGGTNSGWVTFKAEHRWGAKLSGQNNGTQYGIFLKSGANYVRIEGFEIYGTSGTAFLAYNGVHHIEFVGNHIHHAGRQCTSTNLGKNASFIGGGARYVLYERNLVHDIGRYAPGEYGCDPSNSYWQNHDHGVYVEQADDVIIRNNVFYNIKRGFAIQRYHTGGYNASRIWILNNTFAFANPYRSPHVTVQTPTSELRIENNIFYDPLSQGIAFASMSFPNSSVKNNLTYSGVTSTVRPSGVTFIGNLDNLNPQLVDVSRSDFRLQSGSPAVDRGRALTDVRTDHVGASRPRGSTHDIGAYER